MGPNHNPGVHQMVGPVHNPMQQQHSRSEGNSIFSASDNNVIMTQVISTHLPDGTDVDVKPFLHIVQDILRHATINADPISSVFYVSLYGGDLGSVFLYPRQNSHLD